MTRAALVAVLVLATATPAAAALFRWTAADGVTHYTSDLDSIPEAYRAGAVDIGAPAARPAPPAAPIPSGLVVPFTGGAPVVVEARLNGVLIYSTPVANLANALPTIQIGNEVKAQAYSLVADNIVATMSGGDTTPPDTSIDSGPTARRSMPTTAMRASSSRSPTAPRMISSSSRTASRSTS